MKNLQLNQDEYKNLTIGKVFAQKIDKMNITDMLSIVVRLLNYKYTQILKNYVEIVTLSIRECEKYSTDNLLNEFINCTRRIEYAVKNSTIMFHNLYEVMTFMSYLDIQWLNSNISGNPFVKVEEIYFAYNYINIMEISDQSFYIDQYGNYIPENATSVLLNIKTFVGQLYLMTENDEEDDCILAELPVPINYNLIFEKEYLNFKSRNPHSSTFDFVKKMLDSFCNLTIENEYEDLGFEEILNPSSNKCYLLNLPRLDSISQEKGIENLNILLNEGNWKTMEHLYIKYDNQVLSANRVLRDHANINNFRLKKQYFTLLLKCRFFDILKKFNSYLYQIVEFCKEEKVNIKIWKNPKTYIDCVKDLAMVIGGTLNFFSYINTAMEKLKQASIWLVNKKFYCLSPIKDIVNYIINWMDEKNLLRDVFANTENINLKEVADKYFNDVQSVKYSLQVVIKNINQVQINCCFYHEKPVFSKKDLLSITQKSGTSLNIDNLTRNPFKNFKEACKALNTLCEDFITTEFRDLGFDRIN
ncbi:uncharacterized protein LOC126907278 [Daktulosphaira vitifoliae]|uniref:uncharacterized protein LOC126907278 n=1 Tax=Daktulosphaira vitifoliae TaxID=58002 RepID=UPI0021A9AFD1|nr:uncharacterized protein LOC126907278 [Daktulosphaira vitifoliae]